MGTQDPPSERPFESMMRMITQRAKLAEERRRQRESDNAEERRPKTEQADTRPAPTPSHLYQEPTSPLLAAVTKTAKHVEASQRKFDRAIAAALEAGEPKTQIAKAANLSPQAFSNRIRRDRRRNPKDRKYGPPPDHTR